MQSTLRPSSSHVATRFLVGILAACALVLAMISLARADETSVFVNGVEMPASEHVLVSHGVAFVPVRSTFEKLGATVHFQGNTATAMMNDRDVLDATIGSEDATVRGNPTHLEAAPFKTGDHVYIPLSVVARTFSATVNHGPNGYEIAAAAPGAQETTQRFGPRRLWLVVLAALAALLWFRLRRRPVHEPTLATGQGTGPTPTASGSPLASLLISDLPAMSNDTRSGLAQSIMSVLERFGYGGAGRGVHYDPTAARSGDVNAVSDLVKEAAVQSPQGLREGVASYARSAPSFFQGLSANDASQFRGLLGF